MREVSVVKSEAKRLLSVIAALSLALSLIPAGALFATPTDDGGEPAAAASDLVGEPAGVGIDSGAAAASSGDAATSPGDGGSNGSAEDPADDSDTPESDSSDGSGADDPIEPGTDPDNPGTEPGDNDDPVPTSIAIKYRYYEAGQLVSTEFQTYDPERDTTWPEVFSGRTVRFSATVTYSDNSTLALDELNPGWTFKVERSFDEQGTQLDQPLLKVADNQEVATVDATLGSAELSSTIAQAPGFEPPVIHVNVTAVPAESVYPVSLTIAYDDVNGSGTPYEAGAVPSITSKSGQVRFRPTIVMSDGSTMAVATGSDSADAPAFSWSITGATDWRGNAVDLGQSLSDTGVLSVSRTANGYVNVRFALDDYPDIAMDMQVRVSLVSSDPYPVRMVLYTDANYEQTYSSPLIISSKRGMVELHPMLVMSNGTLYKPSYGEALFEVVSNTDFGGNALSENIVDARANGTIRARNKGDGIARVRVSIASVAGLEAYGDIRVMNNSGSVVGMDMNYSDATGSNVAYDEGRGQVPAIRDPWGYVQLQPQLTFAAGYMLPASMTDVDVNWQIVRTVDENGLDTNKVLATVTATGYVVATCKGDGSVYVRCTLPEYPEVEFTARVDIWGNGDPYVTSVVVLDANGYAPGMDAIEVFEPGSYQLHARVTYSNGVVKDTWNGDVIENLEWSLHEGNPTYATIDRYTGQLMVMPKFRSDKAIATVKGGRINGTDISGSAWVNYSTDNFDDDTGTASNTLTIKVVYETEYRNKGKNAEAVITKTLSADQVRALGTKVRYYTFSRGPDTTGRYSNKWGLLISNGITFRQVMNEVGATDDNLLGFRIVTTDDYNPVVIDSNILLSARSYYPNFSVGLESGRPSSAGATSVEASLALESTLVPRVDRYGEAGESYALSPATRFRLCYGLSSVRDSNTFGSAKYVKEVIIIVKDNSYSYKISEDPGDGMDDHGGGKDAGDNDSDNNGEGSGEGTGGSGKGSIDGDGQDGGTGNLEGPPTDSSQGLTGGVGGASSALATINLREVRSVDPTYYKSDVEVIAVKTFIWIIILICIAALITGGLQMYLGYKKRRRQGAYGWTEGTWR